MKEESVSMGTVRGPDVLPVDWTADTIGGTGPGHSALSDPPATPLKHLIVPLSGPAPGR
ncbi:hypothetical protein [Streptomyces sp. NBC_01538]|uniref:hypothetical protein n=1 Tax=Streptomyces sp. NBC_01538 TaxID=2903897 RepID=UPI0038654357